MRALLGILASTLRLPRSATRAPEVSSGSRYTVAGCHSSKLPEDTGCAFLEWRLPHRSKLNAEVEDFVFSNHSVGQCQGGVYVHLNEASEISSVRQPGFQGGDIENGGTQLDPRSASPFQNNPFQNKLPRSATRSSLLARTQPDALEQQRDQFALATNAGLCKQVPKMHPDCRTADTKLAAALIQCLTFHQQVG